VAARSLGNLPQVVLTETDRLATYDVLWADTLIFTRETVGMAGGPARFEVAEGDFVREEGTAREEPPRHRAGPVVSEKSYDLIDATHTYTFVVDGRPPRPSQAGGGGDLQGERGGSQHHEP